MQNIFCRMSKEVTNQKLVSIIIPCYNGENFIEQAIQSVLTQTYANWELLIIDDGSTDKTAALISTYLPDKRIQYYYKNNGGVSAARNFGLDKSVGEFIVFLDTDDMIEPQFLQKRVLFLQNNPYYSACCTSAQIINEHGIQQPMWNIGVHDRIAKQILSYKTTYATCPSNYLFIKHFLTDNRLLFDTELSSSADRYFLLECGRYIKIGLIYNDHDARLLYRMHETNMSRVLSPSLLDDNRLDRKSTRLN